MHIDFISPFCLKLIHVPPLKHASSHLLYIGDELNGLIEINNKTLIKQFIE